MDKIAHAKRNRIDSDESDDDSSETSQSTHAPPSGQAPQRGGGGGSGGGTLADKSDADDIEVDDDHGQGGASSKPKKGGGMGLSETSLTVDQMVQNCLHYILLSQNKKIPVKRSDLIKHAMNSQNKQFAEVMTKLEKNLDDILQTVFYKLYKLEKEKGKEHAPAIVTAGAGVSGGRAQVENEEDVAEERGAAGPGGRRGKGNVSGSSYMLISKYSSRVCDCVTRRDPEADSKKTVLYLTLITIFMLNRPIEEELIWKIIHEMQLDQMVCGKREDLRKFIELEFVSPGYLHMELRVNDQHPGSSNPSHQNSDKPIAEHDLTGAKYTWGPRANKEYSKYHILKFVTSRFPGRHPYEFTAQYNICKQREKDLIDKDLVEERDSDTENDASQADGDNGSALNINKKKQGAAGGATTFLIEDEATEVSE